MALATRSPNLEKQLDKQVTALARQIAHLGTGRAGVYQMSWWSDRMLAWAMSDPAFKTQLFRLVDVFPATTGDADTLRHIHEYLGGGDAPKLLEVGVGLAERLPGGERISATVARRNITRMAGQFIIGTDAAEVAAALGRLWRTGSAATVDLLGEKTVTAAEADGYAGRVRELLERLFVAADGWAPDDHLGRDDVGAIPRVSVSVKPTALAPRYAPLTAAEGKAELALRLGPLLDLSAQRGALVFFDMEHYDVKDLTLEAFEELAAAPGLESASLGIVLQAYLRDSYRDLQRIVAASVARVGAGKSPFWVRLVKGAYWDTECVHARAEGWPEPVFLDKAQTDANYERCVRLLHDHHGEVRAAFGSHNLRSLAYAVCYARSLGIPDSGYELQMLHGMAEPVQDAIRQLGLRLRIYAPMGELVPGMSYLIRRLLENTSNESFVRHRFAEGRGLDALLAPPRVGELPGPTEPTTRGETDVADPGPYRHEPVREWRRSAAREELARTLRAIGRRLGSDVPGEGPIEVRAFVAGEEVETGETIASVNPSHPSALVGVSASCGVREADEAVAAAAEAFPVWQGAPAAQRAATLFRAAAWMRHHREELSALEVLEAGKPWPEADADVCEAVDFCEYYGREALRLDGGGVVNSPPGEANNLRYQGKGVATVIAPWNFPLAIPTGMVVAALAAGNTVVLKPAEQTPVMAAMLVQAFREAGLPPGCLNLLPGLGEVVGARLVEHPETALVAFTGSLAVGLAIYEAAARHRPGQRHLRRVIAELGGKNAIVVDADADLDQAVPAVLASAFGFAGQKCSAASRVVVHQAIASRFVERLVGAGRELVVGDPISPSVAVGPVIDADALERVRRYVGLAPDEGRVVLARTDVPDEGYFVGPHIVDNVGEDATLVREEIFGPVLAIQRASSFEEALRLANNTDYALTAGIFSRSPARIAEAASRLRAGNVYVNRGITGAVPGQQPFGGYGLSGIGSKAGGPDYLLQFCDPRVVTENTVRQGFAPELA